MDIGLIKRACFRQLRFRGLQSFLLGSIISLGLVVAPLFYDLGNRDILPSIVVGYGAVFLVYCLSIIRFFRMIRRQERQFGIFFSDGNPKSLWKNAPGLLTDDWFIFAGSAAFYREYIKDMDWRYQKDYRAVGRYCLIVKTIDGRCYRLPLDSKSGCVKVRRWWKYKTGEDIYGL